MRNQNLASPKPMRAYEIVGLFATLLRIDVATIANIVGNIPRANLAAWLAGTRENLRHESVLRLLELLGLRPSTGLKLDPTRVHNWYVRDDLLTNSEKAYASLRAISKLMDGCSITRVEPPGRSLLAQRTRQVYLLSGPDTRIVLHLHKSIFKQSRISPELLIGAEWRDRASVKGGADDHVIRTTSAKWKLLESRDVAPFEFDQIFNQCEPKLAWPDVALVAREYAVTPDHVHDMIQAYGKAQAGTASMRYRRDQDAEAGMARQGNELPFEDPAIVSLARYRPSGLTGEGIARSAAAG